VIVSGDVTGGTQKMLKKSFAFACHWTRHQITARLAALEPSTQFWPQCDCQLHRQRTKLAGHFHCNGAKKRVQLHMQTDWNVMSLHAKKTYFSFMILSTIAKNMPLNMLSTKPEFEIHI
jgi:hypothetical protein